MYACMHVCMYACMHVCMYVYIYIYVYDFHIMLYKVAFFPYTIVCRVQNCIQNCVFTFSNLYNKELIVHAIINIIYIFPTMN